ncbi:N-acyl-L-amino acid amidohydrolase [candidate division KSB1 bacterium 4572_119]|nr:MAG: N-acyl-L-amino acid amidohydrolase [candidate division KSB1 bacterium 4572_119]
MVHFIEWSNFVKKYINNEFKIWVCLIALIFNFCFSNSNLKAQENKVSSLRQKADQLAKAAEKNVINWRRDFHQHPELSNREFLTAKKIAQQLKDFGLEVKTGIAHTGVVGILRGSKDNPVVALRADMDALPVTEALDLEFASKVKANFEGKEVGVMHACGHDAHMAMLLGVAEVLSKLRDQLPGTVKFIFQPAEEGAPDGENGGAELMIQEGALENPKPDAIFGLHVFPFHVGQIQYRPGPIMASVDGLQIVVKGKQTHGAIPWGGIDPVVVASQIVLGLQSIISRQIDITEAPAVISIGSIHGGVRGNIIPDQVELIGTIRTFDADVREDVHARVRKTAESIAQSAGAIAEVEIYRGYPVTKNDPALTEQMLPVLRNVAGADNVNTIAPKTVAEDFSYYQQQIPGLFFFLGIAPKDADLSKVAQNHSPYFYIDESGLILGVRTMTHLAIEFLEKH